MRTALGISALLCLLVVVGMVVVVRYVYRTDQRSFTNETKTSPSMLTLTSPVFTEGKTIPSRFTCEGKNIHPELRIEGVSEGAVSLALLMDDPDIPEMVKQSRGVDVFDHWVVFNIPPHTTVIGEGETPHGIEGRNSAGEPGYKGPCPPDGEHRYFFKLYALDSMLDLTGSAAKADVEDAMRGHIIEEAQLMGVYTKGNL